MTKMGKVRRTVRFFALSCACLLCSEFCVRMSAQNECCTPPHMASTAARFQQNATVNVYVVSDSGFTPTEQDMIKEGLENWNGQPNSSGVTYHVTFTTTPPPPGTNNTIVVRYVDTFS